MDGQLESGLRSQSSSPQIVLRRHAERIRYAIEEGKHRGDINGLSDLVFRPAMVAKYLDVLGRGAICGFSNFLDVVEQRSLGRRQAGLIELALENRLYAVIISSLNTQEVGVTVQSIRAAIQKRDVACNHLLVASVQMALREMNRIGEIHHLAQEVGARAETLDDTRHLRPSRTGAPVVVSCRGVSGRLSILRNSD